MLFASIMFITPNSNMISAICLYINVFLAVIIIPYTLVIYIYGQYSQIIRAAKTGFVLAVYGLKTQPLTPALSRKGRGSSLAPGVRGNLTPRID